MSSQPGNFKNQVCVLRVNIHCDGCKKKVKKLLQKIEGVDGTKIDAELGKVTVSGYVHPNVLIRKLVKSGKHAELWTAPKNNPYAAQNRPRNQFHDLQFEKLSKPQKDGKGFAKDLNWNVGPKAPKSVKFDLPEDQFHESDDEFSDSGDEGDGFELDLGRRPPPRTPSRGGGGYGQRGPKEKSNGHNGPVKNGKSGGSRAKKGGIFGIRLLFFRGFGRKKKSKNSSAGKKGGGGKDRCVKPGAIEFKNGVKDGSWVPENGKNGGKGMAAAKNGGNNFKGQKNQTNGGKNGRGGGKAADFQEIDFGNSQKGGRGGGGGGRGFSGRVGPMANYPMGPMGNNLMGPMGPTGNNSMRPMGPMGNNSMGPMGQMGNNSMGPMGPMGNNSLGLMGPMGNYPMGPIANNQVGPMSHYPAVSQMGGDPTRQVGNYQAVQGLPAPINGGYYQGMGPMGMMMNQPPHGQINGMFHPTMYGRPPPVMGYAPHRASDGYTNMFNDENTESCSIM